MAGATPQRAAGAGRGDEALLDRWDDIVVGAGSGGAVLASRLSEQPDRRVLLLEAGPDRAEPARPDRPLGTPVLTGANWDYTAHIGSGTEVRERTYPYLVGKVVGGSSAVNGAIALRGLPADFDGWAAAGNPEWAWPRVLPYFTRLETDADVKSPEHGTDGPLPIHRPTPEEHNATATAFLDACGALDLPYLPDLNATGDPGVGLIPSNAVGRRRISTAEAYLAPARRRPNLAVVDCARVSRVLTRDGRVAGVEVFRDGRRYEVSADRVTLCGGGVNTPVILQRSGIGAAERLAAIGIPVVADVPGVGANLAEHPVVAIWAVPRPGVCQPDESWHQVLARVATGGAHPDVNLLLVNNVTNVPIPMIGAVLAGRTGVSLSTILVSPVSRGSVTLVDPSPDAPPAIALRLAEDPADVERLMHGVRLAWSVARHGPLAELLSTVLMWTDRMVADDAMLRRSVTRFVSPTWHPAGTARMGPADDGTAVVDQYCRVRGVDGLRVADASVMPEIVSAPTNLSCIMIAERVASWLA